MVAADIGPWRGLALVQGALRRGLGGMLEAAQALSLRDYTVLRTRDAAPNRRMRMTELALAADDTPSGLTRPVGVSSGPAWWRVSHGPTTGGAPPLA